jgi:hypothetical protein
MPFVCPPTVPEPVLLLLSEPWSGSTTTAVAEPSASHAWQVLLPGLHAGVLPPAPHSAFVQQLPGTQLGVAPQQISAELAAHVVPTPEQALEMHECELVSQIVLAPYVESPLHCESLVHPVQKFAVQSSPRFDPVQSADVLQLPGAQLPATQT